MDPRSGPRSSAIFLPSEIFLPSVFDRPVALFPVISLVTIGLEDLRGTSDRLLPFVPW